MRRTFIIVIGLAVLLTIVAVILALAGKRTTTTTNGNTAAENVNVPLDENANTATVDSAARAGQPLAVSVARSFAERYGSWSKATLRETIDDLAPWLTGTLGAELASRHESSTAPASLQSVVSRALSTAVRDWAAESRATIDVTLGRTEARANEPAVEYYETLEVSLVFQGGRWFIENAEWKPSRIQPGNGG